MLHELLFLVTIYCQVDCEDFRRILYQFHQKVLRGDLIHVSVMRAGGRGMEPGRELTASSTGSRASCSGAEDINFECSGPALMHRGGTFLEKS